MKTKYLKIVSALMLLLGCAGCTKENIQECVYGVYLQYYYTYNKHYINLFGPEVQKLSIYVFDKDGLYYDTYTIDDPSELETNNKIHLPLPAGKWTIISWGGFMDTYQVGTLEENSGGAVFTDGLVKGQTSLEEFRLMLKYDESISPFEVAMITQSQPLYWGKNTMVEVPVDATTGATIGVMKNVNELVLKIGGMNRIAANTSSTRAPSDAFNIYTKIQNGRYTYENNIAEYARQVKYLQDSYIVGDTLYTNFTVMRLMEDDKSGVMTIESPHLPEEVLAIPIVETILKNPNYNNQEDLDREDSYEFILDLHTNIGVTLTINGWKVVNIKPDPK